MAAADGRVDQVVICTPDKDLAQCVRGDRIVQLDRRTRTLRDEAGVRQKFGVAPASIPDWLALVGDSADGYPGLPTGARPPRQPCSPATVTSTASRPWPRTGRCRCAARCAWPPRSPSSASAPCSSAGWPAADGWAAGRRRGCVALARAAGDFATWSERLAAPQSERAAALAAARRAVPKREFMPRAGRVMVSCWHARRRAMIESGGAAHTMIVVSAMICIAEGKGDEYTAEFASRPPRPQGPGLPDLRLAPDDRHPDRFFVFEQYADEAAIQHHVPPRTSSPTARGPRTS